MSEVEEKTKKEVFGEKCRTRIAGYIGRNYNAERAEDADALPTAVKWALETIDEGDALIGGLMAQLKALMEEPKSNGWMPETEKPPRRKDNPMRSVNVLLCWHDGDEWVQTVAYWGYGSNDWRIAIDDEDIYHAGSDEPSPWQWKILEENPPVLDKTTGKPLDSLGWVSVDKDLPVKQVAPARSDPAESRIVMVRDLDGDELTAVYDHNQKDWFHYVDDDRKTGRYHTYNGRLHDIKYWRDFQ